VHLVSSSHNNPLRDRTHQVGKNVDSSTVANGNDGSSDVNRFGAFS
jgi:hypothetical protein